MLEVLPPPSPFLVLIYAWCGDTIQLIRRLHRRQCHLHNRVQYPDLQCDNLQRNRHTFRLTFHGSPHAPIISIRAPRTGPPPRQRSAPIAHVQRQRAVDVDEPRAHANRNFPNFPGQFRLRIKIPAGSFPDPVRANVKYPPISVIFFA